jgi:hypothetical protein
MRKWEPSFPCCPQPLSSHIVIIVFCKAAVLVGTRCHGLSPRRDCGAGSSSRRTTPSVNPSPSHSAPTSSTTWPSCPTYWVSGDHILYQYIILPVYIFRAIFMINLLNVERLNVDRLNVDRLNVGSLDVDIRKVCKAKCCAWGGGGFVPAYQHFPFFV